MKAREWKRVLAETLIIVALGLLVALAANQVSPRGLSLTRNYFPGNGQPPGNSTLDARMSQGSNANIGTSIKGANTNDSRQGPVETAMARLKQKGLQSIDGQGALRLFQDPRYEQELVVFVDARGESHYLEGHIPGALQFDRYYPEKYLPAVVAACISAQKVVVYCTGGDCEDSEFAALALKDAGVPAGLLVIYAGGMTDWTAKGWITEIGARKSGNLRGAKEQIRK